MTLDVNNTSILCDDELISKPDPNYEYGCYVALQGEYCNHLYYANIIFIVLI